MTSRIDRRLVLAATLAAAVLAGGCAMMAPKAASYTPPPMGASWTVARNNAGSFGTGGMQLVVTRGERTWQGRKVVTFESNEGTTLADPANGRWIGIVAPGDRPVVSWDPPIGFEWPLEVGKTWTTKYRATNHMTNRTTDFEATWTVQAYEDVTVPAGTFKTFRLTLVDTMGSDEVYWYSPELGIFVKTSARRLAQHPQGPGTRETQVVAQTIRK
jgi:hypothetical protein